jgi:excisionase family DNA binding protein
MSRIEIQLSQDELDHLADRLADRIIARIEHRMGGSRDAGWMTTKEAAEHLGMSVDALHKLTAARAIPFTQDAPRARCYFRRAHLDAWRRGNV